MASLRTTGRPAPPDLHFYVTHPSETGEPPERPAPTQAGRTKLVRELLELPGLESTPRWRRRLYRRKALRKRSYSRSRPRVARSIQYSRTSIYLNRERQ